MKPPNKSPLSEFHEYFGNRMIGMKMFVLNEDAADGNKVPAAA